MKIRGVILLAVSICLVVSACGSKVSQGNFNKIQVGMTFEEVTAILGPSTESSSVQISGLSGTSSKWAGKEGTIQIQFLNGRVRIKQFSRP